MREDGEDGSCAQAVLERIEPGAGFALVGLGTSAHLCIAAVGFDLCCGGHSCKLLGRDQAGKKRDGTAEMNGRRRELNHRDHGDHGEKSGKTFGKRESHLGRMMHAGYVPESDQLFHFTDSLDCLFSVISVISVVQKSCSPRIELSLRGRCPLCIRSARRGKKLQRSSPERIEKLGNGSPRFTQPGNMGHHDRPALQVAQFFVAVAHGDVTQGAAR